MFPEVSYRQEAILSIPVPASKSIIPVPKPEAVNDDKKEVCIYVVGRKIVLKMPKNQDDFAFITSLRYAKWDANNRCWNVPAYPGNLDRMKLYFNNRINVLDESDDQIATEEELEPVLEKERF